MGKLPLNLTLGDPLALMKKLPRFGDPIELDGLLVVFLCISFHDIIKCRMLDTIKIHFLGFVIVQVVDWENTDPTTKQVLQLGNPTLNVTSM
jgi:hypothetical protein